MAGSASASPPVIAFSQVLPVHPAKGGAAACIPFPLTQDAQGNPVCRVASAIATDDCSCASPGLAPADAALTEATRIKLQVAGRCGSAADQVQCVDLCVCEIAAATGAGRAQCLAQTELDPSMSGWCYLSAEQGEAAQALLSACTQQQQHEVRFAGASAPDSSAFTVVSCYASPYWPGPSVDAGALGEPCVSSSEYVPDFTGSTSAEVNIDDHASSCASGMCVQNHFQGRASCPYGQDPTASDCLVAGSEVPVTGSVAPQLASRQTAVASICSCQCAGYGPGPYCTCPSDMECDHLVDRILTPPAGAADYSGSYCIPRGSSYMRDETAVCSAPNCGDAHPY